MASAALLHFLGRQVSQISRMEVEEPLMPSATKSRSAAYVQCKFCFQMPEPADCLCCARLYIHAPLVIIPPQAQVKAGVCLQYERSREAKRVLEASTDAKGRRLEVIKLPLPEPLFKTAEEAGEVSSCTHPHAAHCESMTDWLRMLKSAASNL